MFGVKFYPNHQDTGSHGLSPSLSLSIVALHDVTLKKKNIIACTFADVPGADEEFYRGWPWPRSLRCRRVSSDIYRAHVGKNSLAAVCCLSCCDL